MRVLIGHVCPVWELAERRALPGRADDILCFGTGYDHLSWEPARNRWCDLSAQWPTGWQPDVYIHWSLEYNPVPLGLEDADCFTVGVLGDWNLGGQAFQHAAGMFDLLIADRAGGERLRRAGYDNVLYAPQWGYDPLLHRRLPGVERDLDVVMVGNFNHAVQQGRERWLARVAKLSPRWRICLTGGVFGEDYVRLLNRAKIVFNRSIGGALNMRAYEAPACGALLFYERDNLEVRDLLRDREECVLYGEDDLEELLDHYLTHDIERERVAEAGWRKVQGQGMAHQMGRMLELIEAEAHAGRCARPFCALPSFEHHARRGLQWMRGTDPRCLPEAEAEFVKALALQLGDAGLMRARICAAAEWAACQADPARQRDGLAQAMQGMAQCVALRPDDAAGWMNLANLCLAFGDAGTADAALARVTDLLDAPDVRSEQVRGPYFPHRFTEFDVEVERVWAEHPAGDAAWTAGMRRALLWRAWEMRSDLAAGNGRKVDAVLYAQRAAAVRPEMGGTRLRLARALRAAGHHEAAADEYHCALERSPLSMEAREEAARLFWDLGWEDDCRALLDETLAILDGCPFYAPLRPRFEALHLAAREWAGPEGTTLRLLALPDWSRPEGWRPLIRAYARAFRVEDPVTLLLPVDTRRHPNLETIVAAIETCLRRDMALAPDDAPDMTLMPEETDPAGLFHRADAFLQAGDDGVKAARVAGLPIFTLQSLDQARALLPSRAAA